MMRRSEYSFRLLVRLRKDRLGWVRGSHSVPLAGRPNRLSRRPHRAACLGGRRALAGEPGLCRAAEPAASRWAEWGSPPRPRQPRCWAPSGPAHGLPGMGIGPGMWHGGGQGRSGCARSAPALLPWATGRWGDAGEFRVQRPRAVASAAVVQEEEGQGNLTLGTPNPDRQSRDNCPLHPHCPSPALPQRHARVQWKHRALLRPDHLPPSCPTPALSHPSAAARIVLLPPAGRDNTQHLLEERPSPRGTAGSQVACHPALVLPLAPLALFRLAKPWQPVSAEHREGGGLSIVVAGSNPATPGPAGLWVRAGPTGLPP